MTTLDHAKVGQLVRIDRIQDDEIAMMAVRLGIAVGEVIAVASKVPGGPLVIRRGRVDIALGRELCRGINVSPVSA